MKIPDLRKLLNTSKREDLEKAFVESYKQLRKAQKEEIDPVLIDILEGNAVEQKRTAVTTDFGELENQINIFIKNAYAQNYFAPNRIIPKAQRPKWRFLVKSYIKELEKITPESDNYSKAVKLLTDIYNLICYACDYYLFSTDNPFRSIGWKQQDLFELVVKKTFVSGYTRENIRSLLLQAATGGLSRESLYVYQELTLLHNLKTSDVKYIAIEESKKLVSEKKEKLLGLKKYDNKQYDLREAINNLCDMILLIAIQLSEPEPAVDYYFKNSMRVNKEITLYCALDLIEIMDDKTLWIKVYEYGIRKKIKPRDSLQRTYHKLKDSDSQQ